MVRSMFAALVAAALLLPAAALAQEKPKDDKAAQAAKEKREKELAKAKEDLEKKFKGLKADPAPAISFLCTLVEQAEVEVAAAKDLVEKVLKKKGLTFEEANKACDKVIADNPKDPKKVVKDLGEWISKWKPPEKKPGESPKPSESPKAGEKG